MLDAITATIAAISSLLGATGDTINDFIPEDRSISECISALPRPGCGSEARGGWRQGVILLAILLGLAVISWRIIVASRRARRDTAP